MVPPAGAEEQGWGSQPDTADTSPDFSEPSAENAASPLHPNPSMAISFDFTHDYLVWDSDFKISKDIF